MRPPRRRLVLLLVVGLLLLAACNYPGWGATPPPRGPDQLMTAAAQTLSAQLTLSVIQPSIVPGTAAPTQPNQTIAPSTPPGGEATPAPPTATQGSSVTPTSSPCDRGAFVKDVNYPDDSQVEPGLEFSKTWRLKNTGTCTWNTSYTIVFDSGDALGSAASAPLPGTVAPGQEVDISLELKAPETPGTYEGSWKLRNSAGLVFGLGEQADKTFWVKIKVGVVSGVTYDFLVQAPKATWTSHDGGSGMTLTFGGGDEDPNGVAKLKDDIELENGKAAGVTLVTHPKHAEDGKITGIFPEYTIQEGDHFKAKSGFLEGCGVGQVLYQFGYKIGDDIHILKEWSETCDGKLTIPNIDLSDLKGKKVQFVLAVLAEGSPDDDLAIWGSARIER